MSIICEMTKAYLDSRGVHYETLRDDTVLRLGFGGLQNKGSMEVMVYFDDNDRTISLRSYNLCQIPKNKVDVMYRICNELNNSYRWIKFFVDENDNTITAQDDAVVQADSSGEEIYELMCRMTAVVDKAYPDLMRALWT